MIYRHLLVVPQTISLSGYPYLPEDQEWLHAKSNISHPNAPRTGRARKSKRGKKPVTPFTIGILSSCKQIYAEARPILYGDNVFGFSIFMGGDLVSGAVRILTHGDEEISEDEDQDDDVVELPKFHVPKTSFYTTIPLLNIKQWKLIVDVRPHFSEAVAKGLRRVSEFLATVSTYLPCIIPLKML